MKLTSGKVQTEEEAEEMNDKRIDEDEEGSPERYVTSPSISTSPSMNAESVLLITLAQQVLTTRAERGVQDDFDLCSLDQRVDRVYGPIWFTNTRFLKYRDLYKQCTCVAELTTVTTIIAMKPTISENSECLAMMLAATMEMMLFTLWQMANHTVQVWEHLAEKEGSAMTR